MKTINDLLDVKELRGDVHVRHYLDYLESFLNDLQEAFGCGNDSHYFSIILLEEKDNPYQLQLPGINGSLSLVELVPEYVEKENLEEMLIYKVALMLDND